MEHVEQFDHKGLTVRIEYDHDPESPREWDNLGTMVCWHNRYNLGDKHGYADSDAFLQDIAGEAAAERIERWHDRASDKLCARGLRYGSDEHLRESDALRAEYRARLMAAAERNAIILPLYLYDHSGITISTGAFSCPWDSGQVGYVYILLSKVREEYKVRAVTAKVRATAIEGMKMDVSTYDDYLTGQVYGYVVEDPEGEHLDSCWGFYGLDYCRDEARDSAECQAVERDATRDATREAELIDCD